MSHFKLQARFYVYDEPAIWKANCQNFDATPGGENRIHRRWWENNTSQGDNKKDWSVRGTPPECNTSISNWSHSRYSSFVESAENCGHFDRKQAKSTSQVKKYQELTLHIKKFNFAFTSPFFFEGSSIYFYMLQSLSNGRTIVSNDDTNMHMHTAITYKETFTVCIERARCEHWYIKHQLISPGETKRWRQNYNLASTHY